MPTALATWDGALLSNALWRLKQVVDVWQDCRSLRLIITNEARHRGARVFAIGGWAAPSAISTAA